jgi:hypothetical protein
MPKKIKANTRRYTQLYLGSGYIESASIPLIPVAAYFSDGGFKTWQEAVENFRTLLIGVLKRKRVQWEEDNNKNCQACVDLTGTDTSKFCPSCGRKLLTEEDLQADMNAHAAEWFRSWFSMDVNEFGGDDWQLFEANGWQISCTTSGGFVVLQGFDRILEDWDNPDEWRDGNLYWNSDLISTGESTVDEDDT